MLKPGFVFQRKSLHFGITQRFRELPALLAQLLSLRQ